MSRSPLLVRAALAASLAARGCGRCTVTIARPAETFPLTEGFGGGVRPVPAPDGRSLAYVSRRDAESVLLLRDLETGAERLLARGVTRDEQEGFAQMDLWPGYAFTPDG